MDETLWDKVRCSQSIPKLPEAVGIILKRDRSHGPRCILVSNIYSGRCLVNFSGRG